MDFCEQLAAWGGVLVDNNFIIDFLQTYYDELTPTDFYRSIFPAGELEQRGQQEKGKYNAIAVELLPQEDKETKANALRHIITDDLEMIEQLQQSNNFIIISPISYAGRSRKAANARFIYALAIDFDGITEEHYLIDLFHQMKIEYLPQPTFIYLCPIHLSDGDFLATSAHFVVGVADDTHQGNDEDAHTSYHG